MDRQTIDDYLAFRGELREALREMTPEALRRVIRRWTAQNDQSLAALLAQPNAALGAIIRRMILEEPQLADLHDAARRWLLEHESSHAPHRLIAPTDRRRTRHFTDRAAS